MTMVEKSIIPETAYISDNAMQYDPKEIAMTDLVAARYRHVASDYDGNPDICALPEIPDFMSIKLGDTFIPVPTAEDRKRLSDKERIEMISKLKSVRVFLPIHSEIVDACRECLLASYAKRRIGECNLYRGKYGATIISDRNDESRTDGFSLIGLSGSGKTSAVHEIVRFFPKAVRHSFPGTETYVQIPIIMMPAPSNSNLAALCDSIATRIDIVVGTDIYTVVMGKEKTVGGKLKILADLIRVFHIGMIIIDECQFLEYSNGAKSFENFVSISEETGVAIGLVGNEEVLAKISKKARLKARFATKYSIDADKYCRDREMLEIVVRRFWKYQWTAEFTHLSESVVNSIIDLSCGNISLMMLLFMYAQLEIVDGTDDAISPQLLKKIASEKLKGLIDLIKKGRSTENGMADAYMNFGENLQAVAKRVDARKNAIEKIKEENAVGFSIDAEYSRLMEIFLAATEFDETKIGYAINMAAKDRGFCRLSEKERTRKVREILNHMTDRANKKIKKQKHEHATDLSEAKELFHLDEEN